MMVSTTLPVETQVHTSRFGLHPCNYETYRMLKRLAWHEHVAWCQYKRWVRWQRKMVHNRVRRKVRRNELNQKIGYEILGPMPEPPLNTNFTHVRYSDAHPDGEFHWIFRPILPSYQRAKTPQPSIDDVQPLFMLREEIRNLLLTIEPSWQLNPPKNA